MDESSIKSVREWKLPQNKARVQSFLGLCNSNLRLIKNRAKSAALLTDLAKKKNCFAMDKNGTKFVRAAEEQNFLLTSFAMCIFLAAIQAISWCVRS